MGQILSLDCGGFMPGRLVTIIALLVSSSAAAQEQTVLLRLLPPAGQVSHYRIEAETSVDAAGAGQFSGVQLMLMSQTVVSVEGDVRVVEMVIDSIGLDGPAAQAMGAAADLLQGLRSRLRMDTRGRVLETTFPDGGENPLLERMTSSMEQSMPAAVLLPEDPVEPGASWVDTSAVTMPLEGASMEIVRNLRYSLVRVEIQDGARHAIISVAGTVTQTMLSTQMGGVAMESSGTLQGEIDIDLDAGRWVRNEIAMAMVSEGPMLPGPMTIQVTVRGSLESP